MWGSPMELERGWQESFVHARSLKLLPPKAAQGRHARDTWLETQTRALHGRCYAGRLEAPDKVVRDKKLAQAGREFHRGRVSEGDYGEFIETLLLKRHQRQASNKENPEEQPQRTTTKLARPASAPLLGRTPQLSDTTPLVPTRDAEELPDKNYALRVHARTMRDQKKTIAWMNRAATLEDVMASHGNGSRRPGAEASMTGGGGLDSTGPMIMTRATTTTTRFVDDDEEADAAATLAKKPLVTAATLAKKMRVIVNGAPSGTSLDCVRERMSSYGRVVTVDAVGRRRFVARYAEAASVEAALDDASKPAFHHGVLVAPIPPTIDLADLKKVLSHKFGRVVGAKAAPTRDGAHVFFASAAIASAALGAHALDALRQVRVENLPFNAKAEHLAAALGGPRHGVSAVRLDEEDLMAETTGATVFFESDKWARHALNAGPKAMVFAKEGGYLDALGKARAAARKGQPAPWHSNIAHGPFASFELHSHNFGRFPTQPRDFKQKAAGTYNAERVAATRTQTDGVSTARFSTHKVKITPERALIHITIEPHAHPFTITPFC